MGVLRILRTMLDWGWSPIVITALAIVGYLYEWPIEFLAAALATILVIGLVIAVVRAREREMELSALRLRQLSGYFNRRFTGNSALSIFAVIDSLFSVENPQLWDWARACDMSRRIFDSWYNSFIDRLEIDTRTGRFSSYLRTYVNELWMAVSHYHEFVEQFYEIAQKFEVPRETVDLYNRFVEEYNGFAQNFQESIIQLKKTAKTEIEAPSVKLARELSVVRSSQSTQEQEPKPPPTTRGSGYYL